MTHPIIADFSAQADKIITYLQTEYSKLQTGRANAALLEHVQVESYGQIMDLKAVAGITVQDARSLVIQPWDKGVLGDIEKAIVQANLGTNPVNDGSVVRINLPPMTEERRKDLTKIVHQLAEEARISIRQARQHGHDQLKNEKEEDVRHTMQDNLQKEVDKYNEQIDTMRKNKDEEIMKV